MVARKNMWSSEEDAEVVRLHDIDRLKWEAIALVMGRSRSACHNRYFKLTVQENRPKRLYRNQWSVQEEADLRRLRFEDRFSVVDIAARLGRTISAVHTRLVRLQFGPAGKIHFEKPVKTIIPQAALDDRDRRFQSARDLTATLCGDPCFAQSALGKKMGASI